MRFNDLTDVKLNVRQLTDDEIKSELAEYFENDYTRSRFPTAFATPEELAEAIKAAPMVELSKSDLLRLDNSDAGDLLQANDPRQAALELASQYGRDLQNIIKAVTSNTPLPAPIVLKRNNTLYLLAGNTRLMAAVVCHRSPIVKIITLF